MARHGEERYAWPGGHPRAGPAPSFASARSAPASPTVLDEPPGWELAAFTHAQLAHSVFLLLYCRELTPAGLARLPVETLIGLKSEALHKQAPDELAALVANVKAMLAALA